MVRLTYCRMGMGDLQLIMGWLAFVRAVVVPWSGGRAVVGSGLGMGFLKVWGP